MSAYLLLALIILGAALYLVGRAYLSERRRRKVAEANAEAARSEAIARQEDAHALQAELERLRSGSPDARLVSSLDILRDSAARTARASADHLAESPPPARDGN